MSPTSPSPGALPPPGYDRSSLRSAIVHIGVGGFHRAHLATYVDELCRRGNTDWAIVGCGILPDDAAMAGALSTQDHLYSLIVRGPRSTEVQIIGSIVDFIHVTTDAGPMIEQLASSATQIISLTITEGGYPVDDLTGLFAPESSVGGPTSAFGLIARGLEARMANNGGPVTILSCDNILSNGNTAKAATLGEAKRLGPALVDWIKTSVSFPNSMVDRITPATTDHDRQWLAEQHGLSDQWPVVTEPFRQWVVEDNFAGDRLPFEQLDVIVTGDVEPYEHMKLRLLNAGHSCLAYLAALDGIETVHEAMADDHIRRYLQGFLQEEARTVLPAIEGIDIDDYIESLLERFSNPEIGDQISRLCLDGSAKLPKFILPTVRDQMAADGPLWLATLAIAGWCQYLLGSTLDGRDITLADDPQLDDAVRHARSSVEVPGAFLNFDAVFGQDLATSERFKACFVEALTALRSGGIRSAIDAALEKDDSHNAA